MDPHLNRRLGDMALPQTLMVEHGKLEIVVN
jgi:hypothetical protein